MPPPSSQRRFPLGSGCALVLSRGDLTAWEGDAIVNAANERMLGGGGVDGAIHRAAGPELLEACEEQPEVRPGVRCPTGEARITDAFGRLRVDHVIHTVGPVYSSPGASAPLLAAAYRSSLLLARKHGLSRVAFPAISCGVYRYPLAAAADIAVTTCQQHASGLEEVAFVLYGEETWSSWLSAAERILGAPPNRAPG